MAAACTTSSSGRGVLVLPLDSIDSDDVLTVAASTGTRVRPGTSGLPSPSWCSDSGAGPPSR
jgi:hypothetical protein